MDSLWIFVGVGLCCLHPLLTVALAFALLDAKGILKVQSPVKLGSGGDDDEDIL